jgi:hypothetical protein
MEGGRIAEQGPPGISIHPLHRQACMIEAWQGDC